MNSRDLLAQLERVFFHSWLRSKLGARIYHNNRSLKGAPVLLRQGELAETRQERFWQIAPGAKMDDPRIARAPRQREALATLAQHPHGVAHQLLSKLMLSKDSLDLLLAKELVTVEVRRHAPGQQEGMEMVEACSNRFIGRPLLIVERQFGLGQPVFVALAGRMAANLDRDQLFGQQQVEAVLAQHQFA